jgi:N-acetylmuramoyl-L-alanine amidase
MYAWRGNRVITYLEDSLFRKPIGLLLAICLSLLAVVPAQAQTSSNALPPPVIGVVKDVRLGAHEDYTRFVIELSHAASYQIFTLPTPYRVVIDLPEMAWSKAAQDLGGQLRNRSIGLITGFRYGLFRSGVSRLVLDASSPVILKSHFALSPSGKSSYRIVVDLKNVATAQFAKAKESLRRGQSKNWSGYMASLAKADKALALRAKPSKKTVSQHPQKDTPRQKVIVLDAGHGGVDPGAIGTTGTYEKDVVLSMAKVLAKKLRATGRYKVVLTRSRDIYIPLRRRYEIAHRARADLFISLHADSHSKKSIQGASVYTLSNRASDKEAERLAHKENKADIIAGQDLSGYDQNVSAILIDMAQGSTNRVSWLFAESLVSELGKKILVKKNTHRFAGFAVLKSPNVPSVLVELGYLSNRRDEKDLKSTKFREKVGASLVRAVDRHFKQQDKLTKE